MIIVHSIARIPITVLLPVLILIIVGCLGSGTSAASSLRLHGWSDRLVVVIIGVGVESPLSPGRTLTRYRLNQVLLNQTPLRKVGHRRPLLHLICHAPGLLRISPVGARLLELGDSFLQRFLLPHQMLHLVQTVLPSEVLQYHQALAQILILVLQLEDFRILIVDQL